MEELSNLEELENGALHGVLKGKGPSFGDSPAGAYVFLVKGGRGGVIIFLVFHKGFRNFWVVEFGASGAFMQGLTGL